MARWLLFTLRMILCFKAAGDGMSLELGSTACDRRQSRMKRTITVSQLYSGEGKSHNFLILVYK